MKDFIFRSSFSSVVKPLVSEEKDLYLAQASLAEVGNFIPDIDSSVNLDCLAIAFNAFVVNRVNKNGDYVDTDTALSFYKNFVNKPINANHNRNQVCGVILNAGFSEFGSDRPLTEEQVKNLGKEPFNVVLGGLIWKLVNPKLAAVVEESNDPTSEDYLSISASWELGFSQYGVGILPVDIKDTSKAKEIVNENEICGYSKYLRANGGDGEFNNEKIYRKILSPALPLGIGLTETPAADVKGIFVESVFAGVPEDLKLEQKTEIKSEEKISQSEIVTVIRGYNKVMIKDFSELNDEMMKQISASEIQGIYEAQASSIHKLYEEKIKEASEKYCAEQTASAQKLKEVEASSVALVEAVEVNKVELAEVKKQLELLLTEKAAATAQDLFNGRMAHFDVEYDLTDADRSVIAADIKDMAEESFAQYQNKMQTLMKEKSKSFKAQAKEAKIEVVASVQDIVEQAIDSGKKEVIGVPHTSSAQEGVFDKFKKAFSEDGFTIKY